MMRAIAITAAIVGAAATYSHHSHYAVLGFFKDKKCSHKPALSLKTAPGHCNAFPGSHNTYFQVLCGYKKYEDDHSKSGSYAGASWKHAVSDYDSSSGEEWSYSSPAESWDDSSSSSSSDSSAKSKKRVVKASHVVMRICRDHGCKKCKRVVVTKSGKCAALPARKHWYKAAPRHLNAEPNGAFDEINGSFDENNANEYNKQHKQHQQPFKPHHHAHHKHHHVPAFAPKWRSFVAKCPNKVYH